MGTRRLLFPTKCVNLFGRRKVRFPPEITRVARRQHKYSGGPTPKVTRVFQSNSTRSAYRGYRGIVVEQGIRQLNIAVAVESARDCARVVEEHRAPTHGQVADSVHRTRILLACVRMCVNAHALSSEQHKGTTQDFARVQC